MDISSWISLYSLIFGRYTSVDNDRDFRGETGVHPEVAETIYQRYCTNSSFTTRKRLLMAFHFLKTYPTENAAYKRFLYKTRTTYRKHLWETLYYLDRVMMGCPSSNIF